MDFDRTRHLSDASIKQRQADRERIYAEKRQIVEEEKRRIAEKEAEARRVLEEKERKREERERKRKERYEAERLRKERERLRREEEDRLAKELAERRQRQIEARIAESRCLLEAVFTHIQRKEDRRKEVQEARLRAEQRAAELEDIPTFDKERYLRAMLLRQREITMREKLKEKIRQAKDQRSPCTASVTSCIMHHSTTNQTSSDQQSSGESPNLSSSSTDRYSKKKRRSSSSTDSDVDKRRQRKKYRSKNDGTEDSDNDSLRNDSRYVAGKKHRCGHKKRKKRRGSR